MQIYNNLSSYFRLSFLLMKIGPQYHLQLMAKLTNKMAKFFNQLAEQCIDQLYQLGNLKKNNQKASKENKNIKMEEAEVINDNKILEESVIEVSMVNEEKKKKINEKQAKQVFIKEIPKDISKTTKENNVTLKDLGKNDDVIEIRQKRQKDKSAKKKKGRPKLDKNMTGFNELKPKMPTSSFLLYLHDNKKQLSDKFNQQNISRLTKLASQTWKDLPPKEKQNYTKKSEETKIRYLGEMKEFKEKFAEEIKEEKRKKMSLYRNTWMKKKKKDDSESDNSKKEGKQSEKVLIENQASSSGSGSSSSSSSSSSSGSSNQIQSISSNQLDSELNIISLDSSFEKGSFKDGQI